MSALISAAKLRGNLRTVLPYQTKAARLAAAAKPVKVTHIINGLGVGGAELALFRLLSSIDRSAWDMQVIALLGEKPLGEQLRDLGFKVFPLHMSKQRLNPFAFARMVRLLRQEQPQVVQTWLQQSDLLGGVAARLAGVGPVLWNIRHSTLHPMLTSRKTRAISKACAKLSRHVPTRIVCCSESARDAQVRFGYCARKMIVIPNGVNTERFKPDVDAYESVRRELCLPPSALLFGAIGRRHPAKDHPNLIRAAKEIASQVSNCHFLLCGEDVTADQPELKTLIAATGFVERFHLLGDRDDVPRLMAALDVLISTSCFSEGFPNVVSEAMASGVPCIVTDVGDSARIVGPTGLVVPPEQPSATARAGLELARAGQDHLRTWGFEARRRIIENFSLSNMVTRYQELYLETVAEYSR
jgi:glycosyltransferase involved in cell wall biosynthesis